MPIRLALVYESGQSLAFDAQRMGKITGESVQLGPDLILSVEEEPARRLRTNSQRQRRISRGKAGPSGAASLRVGVRGDPCAFALQRMDGSIWSEPHVQRYTQASCTVGACRGRRKLGPSCFALVSDPHGAQGCLCSLPAASFSPGQCFKGDERVSQGVARRMCVSLRLLG